MTPFEILVLRGLWLIMRWQMGLHVIEDVVAWKQAVAKEAGAKALDL